MVDRSNVISLSIFTSIISVLIYYNIQNNKKKSKYLGPIIVKELWIYPIKSCQGIKVQEAQITKRGFLHDRMFMIVDSKGRFISQRKYPIMALIETSIITYDLSNGEKREILIVRYKGMDDLRIPIKYDSSNETITVNVWGDDCQAFEIHDGSLWFREVLGIPDIRFVCMDNNSIRQTDPEYAPEGQTGFSDGYPFLLVSQASIDDLNSKVKDNISAKNFRPNIVVSGCFPFAEDAWKKVTFNNKKPNESSILMDVVKPCSRCQIPNINPDKGEYYDDNEPSRSMKSYRTGEAIGLIKKKWKGQLFFGQNLDHKSLDFGTIRVNDIVTTA